MAKPYDVAIDALIAVIDDVESTHGQKLVATSNVVVEIEKYMKDKEEHALLPEFKVLTWVFQTLVNVNQISLDMFKAKITRAAL